MIGMRAALFSSVFLLASPAWAADFPLKDIIPSIVVTGTASVEVKPDLARIDLGVVTEKLTAAEAASENAKTASAVIAMLKGLGVEAADIRSRNVSLAPVVVEERDPKSNRVIKRTLTGYAASNMVEVRIRDVDKAGTLVTKIVESGGNTYRGLDFSVTDRAEREDAIRAEAVADGVRKASLYAKGAPVKLGRILEIMVDPPPSGYADLPAKLGDQLQTVYMPVEPGMIKLSAQAKITFELLPQ